MTNKVARYIMVGGFLGAGKTTALIQLAQQLKAKGLRVGLITNDQGHDLVDTHNMRGHGLTVAEIPGGCFCCRFNSLLDAADQLDRQTSPDVFLAEPVGSCTDLVASVSYPLRRIYGGSFSVAPLSVLVDPRRAARVLGLSEMPGFSEKVTYIYRKQLEEARLIVVNKIDLLTPEAAEQLTSALEREYPRARVMTVSAREGTGLAEWFAAIDSETGNQGKTMELDYQIYAEGEALLGWLNATVELHAAQFTNGSMLLERLAGAVQQRLAAAEVEIAHFKMTLSPNDNSGELAVVSLVGTSFQPEFSQDLSDPLKRGQIIVNLRAEGDPILLAGALRDSLAEISQTGPRLELAHVEHFRPAPPRPVYRMGHDREPATIL